MKPFTAPRPKRSEKNAIELLFNIDAGVFNCNVHARPR